MTPVIARCFERTVYHHYSKKVFQKNLTVKQYAYKEGCSCKDDLIQIQYNYLKALDDKDCNYVRLESNELRQGNTRIVNNIISL